MPGLSDFFISYTDKKAELQSGLDTLAIKAASKWDTAKGEFSNHLDSVQGLYESNKQEFKAKIDVWKDNFDKFGSDANVTSNPGFATLTTSTAAGIKSLASKGSLSQGALNAAFMYPRNFVKTVEYGTNDESSSSEFEKTAKAATEILKPFADAALLHAGAKAPDFIKNKTFQFSAFKGGVVGSLAFNGLAAIIQPEVANQITNAFGGDKPDVAEKIVGGTASSGVTVIANTIKGLTSNNGTLKEQALTVLENSAKALSSPQTSKMACTNFKKALF